MSKKTIVLLVLLNCIVFNTSSVGAYNPINAELDVSDLKPFRPGESTIVAEILEITGDTYGNPPNAKLIVIETLNGDIKPDEVINAFWVTREYRETYGENAKRVMLYGEPQKQWLDQPYVGPDKGEKVILIGKSPSLLEKKYDFSRMLGNRYKAPAMAVYQTYLFSERNRINAIEGIKLNEERLYSNRKRHSKGRWQFIFLFIVPAAQFVLLFNINTIRSFRLKSLLWIIVFLLPILEIILFMSYNSRIPKEMNIRIDLLLIYPLLLLSLILAPLTVVRMSRTN